MWYAESCLDALFGLLSAAGCSFLRRIWDKAAVAGLPQQARRVVHCLALEGQAALEALPPAVVPHDVAADQQCVSEVLQHLELQAASCSRGDGVGGSGSSGSTSAAAAQQQQQQPDQQLARAAEEAHVLALCRCAWLGCTNLAGGSEAELRSQRCKGCLLVRYCSAACQKAAWKQHKAACKALAAQRK